MSAILRLTQESIVLDQGQVIMRGPTVEAVDYYMASGFSKTGERLWEEKEIPKNSVPFIPRALRVLDASARVSDTVRSAEPVTIEIEYSLSELIQGLRVGLYLLSMRGEFVFTSFDTDDVKKFEDYRVRDAGHYVSRCTIPADTLNEGRYAIGVNASAYRVRRYFQDERALTFNVDALGAPGKQWAETRLGLLRPRLEWSIEKLSR
jgi:lipopolysaccharide transport system ATP-binding protein